MTECIPPDQPRQVRPRQRVTLPGMASRHACPAVQTGQQASQLQLHRICRVQPAQAQRLRPQDLCVRACRLAFCGRESWMRCTRTARGRRRPICQPACTRTHLSGQRGSQRGAWQARAPHMPWRSERSAVQASQHVARRPDHVTGKQPRQKDSGPRLWQAAARVQPASHAQIMAASALHQNLRCGAGAWQVASVLLPALTPACLSQASARLKPAAAACWFARRPGPAAATHWQHARAIHQERGAPCCTCRSRVRYPLLSMSAASADKSTPLSWGIMGPSVHLCMQRHEPQLRQQARRGVGL